MKTIYHLAGLALLCPVLLNSCSKEDPAGENAGTGLFPTYTLTASVSSSQIEPSSRAYVDDAGHFFWNAQDAVTVWSGTEAFTFTIADYFDDEPSNKAEFKGEADLEDGSTVSVVYPARESDVLTFSLPEIHTQTGPEASVRETMFLHATGTVEGYNVTGVALEHLTGLFQFRLTNELGRDLAVSSIEVEAGNAVFPTSLTLDGGAKNYAGKVAKLTLDMQGQTLAADGSGLLNGYMNLFPTGDISSETLTIRVKALAGENEKSFVVKSDVVSSIYGAGFTGYEAGKRYVVNLPLKGEYEADPEGGYDIDASNVWHVYNAEGLAAWHANGNGADVKLEKHIDMNGSEAWTPVDFDGVFDGNGKSIINLTLTAANDAAGFLGTNTGAIRNLTLSSISLAENQTVTSFGVLAAINKGEISNCHLLSSATTMAITVKASGQAGVLAGANEGANARIIGCTAGNLAADGTSVGLQIAGSNSAIYLGGAVGRNGVTNIVADPMIAGCAIYDNVSLSLTDCTSNSNVGALVGWFAGGSAMGCYTLASVDVAVASLGGLVGQFQAPNTKRMVACYTAATLKATTAGSSNVGGLVGRTYNASGTTITGCYTAVTNNTNFFATIHGSMHGNASGSAPTYVSSYHTGMREGEMEVGTNSTIAGLDKENGTANLKSAAELRAMVAEINAAVVAAGCTDYEYYSDEADDVQPLKLRSTAN